MYPSAAVNLGHDGKSCCSGNLLKKWMQIWKALNTRQYVCLSSTNTPSRCTSMSMFLYCPYAPSPRYVLTVFFNVHILLPCSPSSTLTSPYPFLSHHVRSSFQSCILSSVFLLFHLFSSPNLNSSVHAVLSFRNFIPSFFP